MFPPRKILFPVDFSARCTMAARMVETFAGHFKARLTLLHVVEPIMYTDLPGGCHQHRGRATGWLSSGRFQDCEVERVLLHGDAAHKIVDFAHDGRFNLIMLPTHGYGRFRRFILGSVAAKVLHDARCPVWTGAHMEHVPNAEDLQFNNIVCAIDLGKQSCQALRWAGLVCKRIRRPPDDCSCRSDGQRSPQRVLRPGLETGHWSAAPRTKSRPLHSARSASMAPLP